MLKLVRFVVQLIHKESHKYEFALYSQTEYMLSLNVSKRDSCFHSSGMSALLTDDCKITSALTVRHLYLYLDSVPAPYSSQQRSYLSATMGDNYCIDLLEGTT